VRETERLGANVAATAQHDLIAFTGDVMRPRALDTLEIIAESITSPALLNWEVEVIMTALVLNYVHEWSDNWCNDGLMGD
jgi:hypothetical protein